jgi:EAL domain-containing protein (putative c-di-GMP-specific phosphodiesterase class I)
MQSSQGLHASNSENSTHLRRTRRALQICGSGMAVAGAFWAISFAFREQWLTAAVYGQAALVGAVAIVLTRREYLRKAALAMVFSMFFGVCWVCATVDIPTAGVPRTSHIFFLVMGLATFLIFKGEAWWLHHGISLVSFAAYLFFASTTDGWAYAPLLPDSVRLPWAWGASAFGMVMLYAVTSVMQSSMSEQHSLSFDLRSALANRQFVLHFQPQMGAQGQIVGAEALLCWQLPEKGMVSPTEFIPLAEQTGFILPLGKWVLEAACQTLVHWAGVPHMAGLTLAVNVSAQQLAHPNYVDQVIEALRSTGANPKRLKLELTESTLVHDLDDAVAKMTALKAVGVQFAMDDFGTGYSSLNYLKRLPLDQLKIDQSFVRDVLTDPNDAAIARTVVALGKTLGLEVMAEGVETLRQQQFLSEIGCHCFQGYLISRPLPLAEFDTFLKAYGADG